MALDITIDPTQLTTIRALVETLTDTFQVDFIPGFLKTFDETLPLESAKFYANPALQRYELGIVFGVKVGEEEGAEGEEGDAKYLMIGINILIKPDKLSGNKRPAEWGGSVEIPIAETGLTHLTFEGQFTSKAGDMWILQCNFTEEQTMGLPDLLGGVAPGLSALFPEELSIPLRQNLLLVITGRVTVNGGRASRFILGAGFHAGIDLGQVPLLGQSLGTDTGNGAFTLEILVATATFTHKEIKTVSGVLEEMTSPFRIRPSSSTQQELKRGAHLVGHFVVGTMKQTWYMQLKRRRAGGAKRFADRSPRQVPREAPDDALITQGENSAWLAVERSVGPVRMEKLGLSYKDGAVQLTPEVILSVGDLRLVLDGVSVRMPIPVGPPEFHVDGFGLEYENDALRVGGAFLRTRHDGYDEYSGMASLQLRMGGHGIGLAAIGAYAHTGEDPSLFLYASLNHPLGGPPFFFVTGVSGGFGYNRELSTPPLEEVQTFPLVTQAVQGTGGWNSEDANETIAGQLRQLARYLRIQSDAGFLALGVKFTSFKMLDGFALLTVSFGRAFELGLLGLARFQVPFGSKKPLVVVEMALQARFAPSEGVAMVRGQLTPDSYLLSPSCMLMGGFAFATWFAGPHAGDFVLSLGGYHPRFKVPRHYPEVPRVGFDWRVDSKLSLRGESYFTLCAHAVMAGGYFEASFRAGSAWASFRMGADFLICWKPYCYDINLYLHFKFGLGCLSASLGADLHVWGPDFGGYAKLKVFLFSVKVKFGNQDSLSPRAIDWSDFRGSFLPTDEEVCNIAVADGLMRQIQPASGESLWVVNPKQFALTTDSLIPSLEAWHPHATSAVKGKAVGVAPMGVKSSQLTSTQRVSIQRDGGPVEQGKFRFTAQKRKLPEAMWGEPKLASSDGSRLKFPGVNDTSFVDDVLVGFLIEPGPAPRAGVTDRLPVAALRFDPEIFPDSYSFQPLPEFQAMEGDDDARRAAIQRTWFEHPERNALLEALGFDPALDVALDAGVVETFVFAPQVKQS